MARIGWRPPIALKLPNGRASSHRLLQDPNDLLFRMSLALRLVLSKGQTPIHSGSMQGGNVISCPGRSTEGAFATVQAQFGILL
jgi:hypothetical protein